MVLHFTEPDTRFLVISIFADRSLRAARECLRHFCSAESKLKISVGAYCVSYLSKVTQYNVHY